MKIAYTTGDFDILNESHFELFNIIQKYGYENIIVGLLTDEYLSSVGNPSYLSYFQRKSHLENLKYNIIVFPYNMEDICIEYEKFKFNALFTSYKNFDSYDLKNFHLIYIDIPIFYIPNTIYNNNYIQQKFINDIKQNNEYLYIHNFVYKIIYYDSIDYKIFMKFNSLPYYKDKLFTKSVNHIYWLQYYHCNDDILLKDYIINLNQDKLNELIEKINILINFLMNFQDYIVNLSELYYCTINNDIYIKHISIKENLSGKIFYYINPLTSI